MKIETDIIASIKSPLGRAVILVIMFTETCFYWSNHNGFDNFQY